MLLLLLLFLGITALFVIRRFRNKKRNKKMRSSVDSSDSENDLDSVLEESD
jgi:hypothetical protein